MNKYSSKNAQGGFTLIELIVVIVILGILAATALPKFADLGADARIASLNAAKASVKSVMAMAHAKSLINNGNADVVMEGTTVTMKFGYPIATTALATAAGLTSADYVFSATNGTLTIAVVGASTTTSTTNATVSKCAFTYKTAAAANTPPVIENVTGFACN